MATSQESYDVAGQSGFQSRVSFYLSKAAVAVMAESGATAGHAERVAYAQNVLDGVAPIGSASLAVITNSTLQASADPNVPGNGVTDGDLEFTVNSMFSSLAGYAAG